ncbi:pantoate/beta-alanine ligase [Thermodesulfatator indicus DSM 15286]|uniref:Pantothenate synthetase n=1 Tax=Thermodesulfatator indicus (strain DSM 15286 / JCM 11887 / CIR29812) TaxID=667014 RepID=F8A9Y1_THEID|nr:pantoate--beta-alanine ligase [Thermodesulfatator indicus]AEH44182.1 pantoate/beta-alanine ligase [Thermodesulfatator indicus DSM 15286]
MRLIKEVSQMKIWSENARKNGVRIALVPTMGYFHEGHLALMRKAKTLANKVVVSIFVNPIQFGPQEDLKEYPRDLERDASLAQEVGVDVVFAPNAKDMYPQVYQTYVEVTELSKPLCGAKRPGHFKGVATVCLKLFNIVKPHLAVFGLKDYQQFLVVKRMIADLNLDVEIVGHPIVREKDGLAMSSRNIYLSPEERKSAVCLYKALCLAKEKVKKGLKDTNILQKELEEFILSHPYTKVDYIEFRDPEHLIEVREITEPTLLALAVFIGKARLIDNMIIEP